MELGLVNLIRAILIFVWMIPFSYLILFNVGALHIQLSMFQLKILFVLSFISALILFTEWLMAFRYVLYFNKAFSYLRAKNTHKLGVILKKIPVNKCYENGKTLLRYAVDHQMDLDTIYFLLSNNALITYKSSNEYNISYTLFYIASYYDHINEKLVLDFLDSGAYINFIDNSRGFNALSLLQVFVLRCHRDIVNLLLSKGANIHYIVPDLNMNSLMLASKYIHDENIIESLINAGSNVNYTNNSGYSSLLYAAEFNPNPSIIHTLINYGASIQSYRIKGSILRINEVTPLRLAVISNNIDVISCLVDLGDDVNFKDLYGLSILFIASAHNRDVRVIDYLIENGANLQDAIDDDGNTPLMAASYLNGNVEVIKYLINISNNLGMRNREGFSFIDYLRENNAIDDYEKQHILNKFF